jgi:hypothetical protein
MPIELARLFIQKDLMHAHVAGTDEFKSEYEVCPVNRHRRLADFLNYAEKTIAKRLPAENYTTDQDRRKAKRSFFLKQVIACTRKRVLDLWPRPVNWWGYAGARGAGSGLEHTFGATFVATLLSSELRTEVPTTRTAARATWRNFRIQMALIDLHQKALF